ncbi:MAG TPA: HD domain-containing protein [Pyrinomonadaceae bacterium]|nr:HD domain-containing protein [Pyrinomonadaceae bacterium]
MNKVPAKIRALAVAVKEAGGRALLVGGCVRDALMGREPKDWDVEVYGVEPARLRSLLERFGRVDAVGEAFTVYKLGHDLDVSLPRRERKAGRGHRGFVIEGDPDMSVAEAARRRDFTINAILQDPLTGEILDPYEGRACLERKLLRAVSRETFAEDSLRVLRAAQLAARFEFDIEAETIELCRAIDLSDLPAERVWGELEKLLLNAARPSVGFEWLAKLNATPQLFPEINALVGVPQEYDWHPEGWLLRELPFQPLDASVAQAEGVDVRPTFREFFTGSPTYPTMIPTSDGTVNTQPPETPSSFQLVATDTAGDTNLLPPPMSRPAVPAPAESLVWSFGRPAPSADEVFRIMFKIPLDNVRSIVCRTINDFEVIKGIIHPVAVFVMHMFPSLKTATQLQFHDDTVNPNSPATPLPAGVHVTSIVVDARTSAIDGYVLFNFHLAVVRDDNLVHSSQTPRTQRFLEIQVGDVFYHTGLTLDRARELIDDLPYAKQVTVMLAALCHDFGKPATTEFVEGRTRSRGHDEAGVAPTNSFLDRLKIYTLEGYDVRAQVVELVRAHLKPGEFYNRRAEISEGAFRRLARRCELDLLYRVARADTLGRNAPWVPRERWFDAVPQEWFIARARELAVEERPPAPLLLGRHLLALGLQPSPRIGEITRAVYEMQLDGRVRTLEEAQSAAKDLLAPE